MVAATLSKLLEGKIFPKNASALEMGCFICSTMEACALPKCIAEQFPAKSGEGPRVTRKTWDVYDFLKHRKGRTRSDYGSNNGANMKIGFEKRAHIFWAKPKWVWGLGQKLRSICR